MPESPVWLVSRGYWSEVHRLLQRIARANGQPADAAQLVEQLQVTSGTLAGRGLRLTAVEASPRLETMLHT